MENCIGTVPIHLKMTLTAREAAEYSNIGINKIDSMLRKEFRMGKSLRGKECGKGIYQRKDGLYYARFVAKTGKRHEKYLPTLPEARNYYQYALILKIGLTWDAIDFEKRTLTVNKTLEFRHGEQYWRAGPPKTQHSYRTIPLTDRAYEILKEIKDKRPWQKESPLLSQTLEYIDRRTGAISRLVMRDLVFINWRTGGTGEKQFL